MEIIFILASGLILSFAGFKLWCKTSTSKSPNLTSLVCKEGQTVLITGGNKGIGFISAISFALRGAKVIIACRSKERALAAIKKIKDISGGEVSFMFLDLLSLDTVTSLAERLKLKKIKIDILINNAGAMLPYSLTKDGFEAQFQVNFLGHFLLTRLFIQKEILSENARIIHVSSAIHKFGHVDFKDFGRKRQSKVKTYNDTKLLNILFSHELSRRLELSGSKISSISLHPGMINTDFQEHFVPNFMVSFTRFVVKFFIDDLTKGSDSILVASLSPDLSNQKYVYLHETTKCVASKKIDPDSKGVRDKMERIWELSSDFVQVESDL